MGLWNYIQLAAGDGPTQSSLPAVFAAIPVLYTIAESPLERLLGSLLGSLLESLLGSLLESLFECRLRAFLREEE